MPTLAQTLPTNDIGFLRIVASLWGIELSSSDPSEAAVELAESLCDAELLEEVVSTLPMDAISTLEALAAENGRMPWVAFARRFGNVREMGSGKRDREQPHLHPSSSAEILWYRALLAKAFFDGEKGLQEFAFIPDDLFAALDFSGMLSKGQFKASPDDFQDEEQSAGGPKLINQNIPDAKTDNSGLGRPASPAEKAFPSPACDRILDDACTYLASLRIGLEPPEIRTPVPIIRDFLSAARLITSSGPNPQAVKSFLEAPRGKALDFLRESWRRNENFNELRQLPGLAFEGGWTNQPLITREFLLNLLAQVPEGQWLSLSAFVRDIKTKYPDFQRPAGDYDSWFIKRETDGIFLRGFSNWDEIEGRLIRYFICGPLHWLGLVDLASPDEGSAATAFRLKIESKVPDARNFPLEEAGKLTISSQGKITVPRLTPRAARYQITRFCTWEEQKEDDYIYRVTAESLKRAKNQGLKTGQLIGILRKHTSAPIPPPFAKALQRWENNGTEASIENLVVLKVSRPEVLNELRAAKAGRFLGEILGPTTVVIQSGARSKVMAALAEMGLLAEGQVDE